MNYKGPDTPPGGTLPGVTAPLISFYVGQAGTGIPVDGQTQLRLSSLQGQSLVNKQLLVIHEGQELIYASGAVPPAAAQITRYNDGILGGFDFNTGVGPGQFVFGERYDIYLIGINNTIEP